ncbi:hypothetical protein LPC08_23430 [Roseomonas sp. OT10]|uniref:hypothetical protein n=1 Tax=Roseomonas cutis TaxID=2897332 RepID=UPI001E33D1EB|nr:hypothetical protein [Roseomonas sp. OT10]UFN48912.1 hypothetical protein LPC08_23430 [Roseomonas sp. OT10]
MRLERGDRLAVQLPSSTLEALAERVSRLSPSHRDPHRFHEDKSEVVAELRRLARLLGRVA